jgi:hypothetical protein
MSAVVIVDVPFMDAAAKPFLVAAVFDWMGRVASGKPCTGSTDYVRGTDAEVAQLRARLDAEPSLWMLHVYAARARWASKVLDVLDPTGDSVSLASDHFDGLVTRSAKIPGMWQFTWLLDGEPLGDSQHSTAADAVDAAWGDGMRPRKATGTHGVAAARAVLEHRAELDAWNALDSWEVDPPKLRPVFDLQLTLMQGPIRASAP